MSVQPETQPESEARRVAGGAIAQQAAQVAGLLVLFGVVTLLARRLTVAQLGTYGLTATLAVYLLVVKNSVGGAAQRMMVGAGPEDRGRAFTTAAWLYAATGVVTGVLIAGAGWIIATVILDGALRHDARLGTLGLGAVTTAGLAASVNLDAMRAALLVGRAARNEIVAVIVFGSLMTGLALADVPLWALIMASGSIPLISGTLNGVARARRAPEFRLCRGGFERAYARALAPTAGWLLVIEASMLVIYGLDRVVLGVFGSATDVGLYEGPVRAHNLVYALVQATGVATLPVTAAYVAAGDGERLRRLLVDGTRYTAALFVPLTVTLMMLGGPLLEVWLGRRYAGGATALTILVSYWVLYGALALVPNFLVGLGRAREVGRVILGIAALNLTLSVALTPSLGVEGPAIGTAAAYVAGLPFMVRIATRATGTPRSLLLRAAWAPTLALGAGLAAVLGIARLILDPHTLIPVLALLIAGPMLFWGAFATFVLDTAERRRLAAVLKGRADR